MRHRMGPMERVFVVVGVVACLWSVAVAPPAAANEVLKWNETTVRAIESNGQSNVVATRTLAMVQAAVQTR